MRVLLKDLITERLGVPDNLLETAEDIYDRVLNDLKDKVNTPFGNVKLIQHDEEIFNYSGEFKVGPVTFTKINIAIKAEVTPRVADIQSGGAAFGFGSELTKKSKYQKHMPVGTGGEVDISLKLAASPSIRWKDVYAFMLGNKQKMVSDLSHELKHAFDNEIDIKAGRGTPVTDRELYDTAIEDRGIRELNIFYYLVYYTFFIENLVRPSEFASQLKQNGVTKEEFLKFLQENEIYKTLKLAREFNFEDMKDKIANNPENLSLIKMVLKRQKIPAKGLNNKQLVDKLIDFDYKFNAGRMLHNYHGQLMTSGMRMSMMNINMNQEEFVKDANEAMDEVEKELTKFKNNPQAFYTYLTKRMNMAGDKMIRRLAKLYAYIK